MNTRPALLTAALALPACTGAGGSVTDADTEGQGTTDMSSTTGDAPIVVELSAPCNFGPERADELAVVTNDFIAAGLGRLTIDDGVITPDLAPATTDTALGARADWIVMVHRYGHSRIEVVDRGADWTLRGGVDVTYPGVADPNPQGVTFADDGLGYVPLFAAPAVQIFDFTRDPAQWLVGAIDLSAFADADGSPEAGLALACGRVLFVAIQRLVNFDGDEPSYLVAVDLDARAPLDLDADVEGTQAIALLGTYPRQLRRDPADLAGHTALVLTSGIERVDLAHGTSTWAVTPEVLAAAGIEGFDPQAFALAPDGRSIFLTATDGEFPAAAVFHVGLDGEEPAAPVKFVSGLVSGDRMLEQLDGALWVGDADPSAPRLRRFDLGTGEEDPKDGLPTNLAPWTFIPLP